MATSAHVSDTSDAGFQSEVLDSKIPVLVDFWAEWCGPCKMVGPLLEEIAPEYKERLKIVKLDVDANPEAPARYGIRGIPTLLLFKNGNVESTKVGTLTRSQLTAFIDQLL